MWKIWCAAANCEATDYLHSWTAESSGTGLPSLSPICVQASSSAQFVPLEEFQIAEDYKLNFWR